MVCCDCQTRAASVSMPRLAPADPPLPAIVSTRQALEAGLTPDQVRHRVRSGRWARVGRGIYRTCCLEPDPGTWEAVNVEHAARALAEVEAHPGTAIGFESAAIVRGLSVWRTPPHVSLVAGPGGHNGHRPGVVVHREELRHEDVMVGPPRMTSMARTWLDVSRAGGLADALVLGDAAVRNGAMTVAEAEEVVCRSVARRGIRTARRAVEVLDGLRESSLESASFAYFMEHDVPLPRVQIEIRSRSGRFLGRVDCLWEEQRLVGEVDGRMKYGDAEAVYAEKRREDDIRAEAYGFIRWGAQDLRTDALAHRLKALLH